MRISAEEVTTSDELMREFFGMHDKMIYNTTEKSRYEIIYNYLKELGAIEEGGRKFKNNDYLILNFEADTYLIPKDIFDELDEQWVDKLKKEYESPSNNKVTTL